MKGLVIKNTGSWYTVKTDDGQLIESKIKGNFRLKGIRSTNPVAVGDHVEIITNQEGTALFLLLRIGVIILSESRLISVNRVISSPPTSIRPCWWSLSTIRRLPPLLLIDSWPVPRLIACRSSLYLISTTFSLKRNCIMRR